MKDKKKIGIVWADFNSSNLGVSALSYSLIIILEKIRKNKNQIFQYYLWGNNKE